MADMYKTTTCSSSPSPPPETDDLSLFLHQFLLRSSSYSDSPMENPHRPIQSSLLSQLNRHVPDRISAAESSSGLNPFGAAAFSSSGGYFQGSAANASSPAGTIDNDPDEYDCESEEGLEAQVEEGPAKPVPPRNPSKRSRAAEVHNLSEKRRRSRINEKMKALQKLIPNSNKTDKASMLDEAIEYLKQLQLQVQMLTMRNGLSLYPICLPGALQPAQLSQMRMGFYEGNGPMNMDATGIFPLHKETPMNTLFDITNQSTNQGHFSSIINSEASFGLDSSTQGQPGPFQLQTSSQVQEICRADMSPHQQLNADNHSWKNSLAKATVSKLEPDPIISSHLNRKN